MSKSTASSSWPRVPRTFTFKLKDRKDVEKIVGQNNDLIAELENDIKTNYAAYKDGILQIERARDYRRLYAYYKNVGDQVRAWKFRLLANDSLAAVSKRALFHRQQGVLAILYNSNESMDLAQNYFGQAQHTFDFNGLDDLSTETQQLNNEVY